MKSVLILALLAVAACGADGDPIRPEARSTVTLGTGGVGVSTGVSVRGRVSVGISS